MQKFFLSEVLVVISCLVFGRRNLEYFDSCHGEKVRSCDSDCTSSAGELIVKIPKDTYSSSNWGEWGGGRCEMWL